MCILAADIGGTKTNLAVYPESGDPHNPLLELTFSNASFSSFDQIIDFALRKTDGKVRRICLGVAGPILDDRVQVTNLPWVIDRVELGKKFGFREVVLLNDLESIANAIPILQPEDLDVINPGISQSQGSIAVIAPGTGLGEAYLTWDGSRYRAHPSEGGHADFAPTNPVEERLLGFLRGRFKHVSYERICSGMGLPNIYDFYKESGGFPEPPWLAEELATCVDPTPVIVRAALDPERTCELCQLTLRTFVSILGSETGNLALKVFATGGVYLAGGMPPKILPALLQGNFVEAFSRKGRFSSHMRRFPISLIRNEKAALLGAANFGLNYATG